MPASLLLTYRAMARNNAWSNHRLLAACAGLSQPELEAKRTSFFPSIKATLNHILIIDWFYVDALEGGWLGPKAFADETPCATVADLQREQGAVDRRLIAHCDGLTVKISSGQKFSVVGKDQRIVCHRINLSLDHTCDVRYHIAHGPVHLGHTAQTIRVLNLVIAVVM